MQVAAILRRAVPGPINRHITVIVASATITSTLSQQQQHNLLPDTRLYHSLPIMGKKKPRSEYNDFLDGEKLRDNAEIRTSLQGSVPQDVSSLPTGQHSRKGKKHGKSGAKKPPLTHFLCLPLVTDTSRPQIQQGLDKFKQDLVNDSPIPTKAVRPVGTLHLTLGVMSLSAMELEKAKQYLENLDVHTLLRDITHRRVAEKAAEDGEIGENLVAAAMPDTNALTIDLEALVPMQTPQNTSILYAEPRDPSRRLSLFASTLREQFIDQGFLVPDTRPLKLHATIMNTIYAKPKQRRGRSSTSKLKHGLKHIEHKVSPHHQNDRDAHPDGEDDGASTAGSADGDTPGLAGSSTMNGDQDQVPPVAGEGHGPDGKSWMRFDARNLIEKYKGFIWARDVRVDRVCICEMGAKKIWSGTHEGDREVLDEQYKVVAMKGIFE
jgi:activating signal cointegrator complex subunit 1